MIRQRIDRVVLACVALGVLSPGAVGAGGVSRDGSGALQAGVAVHAREVYYDISGSTAEDLWKAMRALGPQSGGRRVFGYHSWNVRWNFRYAPGGGECRMKDVQVELTSTITLPRWRPPAVAPDGLVAQWDAFVAALTLHEQGHRDLSLAAAREIERALRRLRHAGCAALDAQANALANRILGQYRERDRRYDAETGSGRTQGAIWPPGNVAAESKTKLPGQHELPEALVRFHLPVRLGDFGKGVDTVDDRADLARGE